METLDELLDQWWDQELVANIIYWLQRSIDAKDSDPSCHVHYRVQLHMAVKALRAWRDRSPYAYTRICSDEVQMLEQLDAQLTDEVREFECDEESEKLN